MTAGYYSSDGLRVALDGAILRITLDRPKRKNALDDDMTRAIIGHLERAQNDESVRCILLTGAGDDFCSGFDIISRNESAEGRPRVGGIQRRLPGLTHRLVPLLLDTQVPVVCAVRGWAAGIGLHLVLASDFAVVASDARLWEPFTTRGFTPDSGGTWLLPRLVGFSRAKELLMLGRELSGAEAHEWGLVHAAVDDGAVAAEADDLAARLAAGPTVTLGLTKWLIHRGTSRVFEEHLVDEAFAVELSSRTDDFREGLAALREKRDPKFTGR
jgi:2-(1,2-epoxy-1,2-dihydrophenyl)acetyl-CoA isomerase